MILWMGTWSANISLDGSFDLQYRADTAPTNELNVPGTFAGTIRNRENIGKTADELIALWNTNNPTALVE